MLRLCNPRDPTGRTKGCGLRTADCELVERTGKNVLMRQRPLAATVGQKNMSATWLEKPPNLELQAAAQYAMWNNEKAARCCGLLLLFSAPALRIARRNPASPRTVLHRPAPSQAQLRAP